MASGTYEQIHIDKPCMDKPCILCYNDIERRKIMLLVAYNKIKHEEMKHGLKSTIDCCEQLLANLSTGYCYDENASLGGMLFAEKIITETEAYL